MPIPPTVTPGQRRPGGVNRLGLAIGSLAAAGTLALAFVGLGGPPTAAAVPTAGDSTAPDPAVQRVVVKTVYVQLPSPTAAPAPAARTAPPAVVTRQSGSGGEGNETEGDD